MALLVFKKPKITYVCKNLRGRRVLLDRGCVSECLREAIVTSLFSNSVFLSPSQVGERVVVSGASGTRPGVLRYTGTVKFAPGYVHSNTVLLTLFYL